MAVVNLISPRHFVAACLIGIMHPLPLWAHGPLHEQIAALSLSIQANPTNANLFFRRGELRYFHEEPLAALTDFRTAAILDPAMSMASLGVAKALLANHQPAEARDT